MAWSAELHGHGSVMSHADRPRSVMRRVRFWRSAYLVEISIGIPLTASRSTATTSTGGANSQALADATGIPKWIKNSSSHRGDE